MLYSRKSIYSTAIIAFTILAYFSIGLFPKLYRKYSLYSLLNSQNCDIDYIKSIPDNFSVIAGHIYGSPFSKNDFINKKIESFLVRYKNNINNVFLTGDIFAIPTKEKWEKLITLLQEDSNIFIAPGNHDVGSKEHRDLFIRLPLITTEYPHTINTDKFKIIVEDSTINNWALNDSTLKLINNYSSHESILLLRHNIIAKEFLVLANSQAGLKGELESIKSLSKKINNPLTIISGDGGAFKKLPRFFCMKKEGITFLINGLGDLPGDIIILISNNKIYKYKL